MCANCQNAAGLCREEEIQRLQPGPGSDEGGDGSSTTDDEGDSASGSDEEGDSSSATSDEGDSDDGDDASSSIRREQHR